MGRASYKSVFLIFLILLWAELLHAQTEILTLGEAVHTAQKSNKTIKKAEKEIELAQNRYQETVAIFLPQITLSYSAMAGNNPLNAFGFKLQQKNITQNDFDPNLLNHPQNTADFTGQALIEQPLFNADLLYKRKAAHIQVAMQHLQKERIQDYIGMVAENKYMQLQFAYQAVSVLEEALESTRSLYQKTKDFYEQGYVQKSDLLQVEVHLKTVETQLNSARNEIHNLSDELSTLMGKSLGTTYQVGELKESPALNAHSIPENRSDFLAVEKGMESYEMMKKGEKMTWIPNLNGFASYQWNDPHLARFHSNSYLAGLQLSWEIFQGNTRKHKIRADQLEKEKLSLELEERKSESRKELEKARRKLSDTRYQIRQSQKAVEQAAEALEIMRNRYEEDLENMTNLLAAETQLAEQELAYQQAVLMHNMTLSYLQFLTKNNKR